MWIDGITPTGKSLSTKAKICPQNRSLLMIDYSVSKRMKYTVRENGLMDDAYPWKAEKAGHQGQHRATGSTSSEVQTVPRINRFDLIIK